MKYISCFCFSFLFSFFLNAQFYIKGQITDEKGNPLQNVSIRLLRTGYLYYSGGEGEFGISSSAKLDTLILSYSGFVTQQVISDALYYQRYILKREIIPEHHQHLFSLTRNLSKEEQAHWFNGNETYASYVENQFVDTKFFPVTALSLHSDKASYSNIRRMLNNRLAVPPDAVRIDEMLNYFNSDFKKPESNKTFEINSLLTECPWNKKNELIFIKINSKLLDLSSLPSSNLVFLLDISGSMDMPNRLPLIKASFRNFVLNLRSNDSISIVVYGGWTGIALDHKSGQDKEIIMNTIESLQADGDTPGASGIELAYRVARQHFIKNGNNRVILVTDGDFNVGLKTEDELETFISNEKESGIYLSCLGMGMGNYKDSKIQALAKAGNGNYAYVDSYAEGEKVLMNEFAQNLYTVANNAVLNISFDSTLVKQYRILGFDNKSGALKDQGSQLEGGEIGSGFTSLVALEIIPVENKLRSELINYNPVHLQLKYNDLKYKAEEINYEQPISFKPIIHAGINYRLGASIIFFGLLLKNSKYINNTSWTELLNFAIKSIDVSDYDQREFIELIRKAKSIYKSGKIQSGN